MSRSREELRALAVRLQRVREEEAVRVARELHDQLGRSLTALKMDVSGIERELARAGVADESARARLANLGERMSQALDETV